MAHNELAIITGATAGIGHATSLALAKSGFDLILIGRRSERLDAIKKEIEGFGLKIQVHTFALDVQDRTAIRAFLDQNLELLKNASLLVNNAGLAKGVDQFQNSNIDDWEAMIDTNIKGLLYLTRGVLPFFMAKNSGHIVNLGSVAGRWVYPGGAVYCATKFAVRAITEGLRQDLLGTNVRVSNIEPGMVETEFSLVRLGSKDKADAVYAKMKPLTPTDIAETIEWVVKRPKHINVQELVIYPTQQAHVGMVHRDK